MSLLLGELLCLWLLLPPLLHPPTLPGLPLAALTPLQLLHSLSPHLLPPLGFLATLLTGLLLSLPPRRPPPRLLLHPWVRPPHTSPPEQVWSEDAAHYRWPSPSLPPTLKRPRPPALPRGAGGPHKTSFYVGGYDRGLGGPRDCLGTEGAYLGGQGARGGHGARGVDNQSYSDWGEDWGPESYMASHSRL